MLCSVLVNIDQQKKVINNLSILDHFKAIKNVYQFRRGGTQTLVVRALEKLMRVFHYVCDLLFVSCRGNV